MFQPVNLDERETLIFESADTYWATRMLGRGVRNRLGPFDSQEKVIEAVQTFFRNEPGVSSFIEAKPFLVYASSSRFGQSHVCLGNVYRDGVTRPTLKEVSLKREEERKRARQSRSRNE